MFVREVFVMGTMKNSAVVGILLASLASAFSPAAQANLSSTELALMSQDVVHSEVLVAGNTDYGQCVARDFEMRNDRKDTPSKIDLLYNNVVGVATLVQSKGGDFTKEKLEFVVKKILATQCGDSQLAGGGDKAPAQQASAETPTTDKSIGSPSASLSSGPG
jgi:hypothetical protein